MNIYEEAKDTIRMFLKNNFTEVMRTYVSKLPDDFIRPSFYIDNIEEVTKAVHLTRFITDYTIGYKIVYFPAIDDAGNVKNHSELVGVLDKFSKIFPTKLMISPEGNLFNIQEVKPSMSDVVVVDIILEINLSSFVEEEVSEEIAGKVSIKI